MLRCLLLLETRGFHCRVPVPEILAKFVYVSSPSRETGKTQTRTWGLGERSVPRVVRRAGKVDSDEKERKKKNESFAELTDEYLRRERSLHDEHQPTAFTLVTATFTQRT